MKHKSIRMMDDDDDSLEDLKDLATAVCLSEIRKRRYLNRPSKYRKSPAGERFAIDLNEEHVSATDSEETAEAPWLTEDEFLQKYRVTRRSFQFILSLLLTHGMTDNDTW